MVVLHLQRCSLRSHSHRFSRSFSLRLRRLIVAQRRPHRRVVHRIVHALALQHVRLLVLLVVLLARRIVHARKHARLLVLRQVFTLVRVVRKVDGMRITVATNITSITSRSISGSILVSIISITKVTAQVARHPILAPRISKFRINTKTLWW